MNYLFPSRNKDSKPEDSKSKDLDFEYKKEKSLDDRKKEVIAIKLKYPDRIPVICEVYKQDRDRGLHLDKKKYLVPNDITFGQFIYIIRKRMVSNLKPEEALYVFINNKLPPISKSMGEIANDQSDVDGYIYALISKEETFGSLPFTCFSSIASRSSSPRLNRIE